MRSGPGGTQIELIADSAPLDDRFREQTYILLALAAGAVLAAAGLAAVQARQLARPLERVAATAARFGDGDFSSSKLPTTQIPEIDRITNALRVSGARVDRMLSTERHFTADATHQLRSGLTGISMRFEILARHPNPEVVDEALAGLSQTEQLNTTIDELLAATRDSTTRERTTFDLVTVVDDHVAEWSPRFAEARRSIAVITMETSRVVGTKGLAGQVIDILIDNALRHGRGSVTLLVEDTSVTVIDQGPGLSDAAVKSVFEGPNDPSARHGRGLPLARRLAQVDGGSVDIAAATATAGPLPAGAGLIGLHLAVDRQRRNRPEKPVAASRRREPWRRRAEGNTSSLHRLVFALIVVGVKFVQSLRVTR